MNDPEVLTLVGDEVVEPPPPPKLYEVDPFPLKGDNVMNVVTVSGGKDSNATRILALQQGVPFISVFADTGHEHEWTLEYVKTLHERMGGEPVIWVKADWSHELKLRRAHIIASDLDDDEKARRLAATQTSGNPMLDGALSRQVFPQRQGRWCTNELKIIPVNQQVILPLLRKGMTVNKWTGMRRDESPARARVPMYEQYELEGYKVNVYSPLVDWTVEDVWSLHHKAGIEPNPLYRRKFTRVGCMDCIYARDDEIDRTARYFPHHIDRMADWEEQVNTSIGKTDRILMKATQGGWLKPDEVDYRGAWNSRGGQAAA